MDPNTPQIPNQPTGAGDNGWAGPPKPEPKGEPFQMPPFNPIDYKPDLANQDPGLSLGGSPVSGMVSTRGPINPTPPPPPSKLPPIDSVQATQDTYPPKSISPLGPQDLTPTPPAPEPPEPPAPVPQPPAPSMPVPANLPDPAPIVPSPTVFQSEIPQDGPIIKPTVSNIRRFPRPKHPILVFCLLLFLLGGSAGAYFGYIVPNNPDKIWAKSLANMGVGLDKLVSISSDYQSKSKGVIIKGSYMGQGAFNGSGTIDSTTYNTDASLKVGLTLASTPLSFELRTLATPSSQFPDIYFKYSGLKNIKSIATLPYYGALISSLDNQWIVIDHSYLQSLTQQSTSTTNNSINSQDTIELEKAISQASKQWLFTTDTTKSVLQVKKKVGKEQQDGRAVYHFKVNISKNNLKSYEKALRDNVKNTKIGKSLGSSLTSLTDNQIDSQVDKMSQPQDFDVWVDTHTKLIHSIRVGTDSNYTQISQDYQGGNKFPFSIKAYSKSGSEQQTTDIKGTIDTSTNIVDMTADFASGANTVNVQLTISPSSNATPIQKPDGAKSIQQILGPLLSGSLAKPAP